MDTGFVLLHRKLLENVIFDNEKGLKVWIWCLLRANFKDRIVLLGRKKVKVSKGEFIMGSRKESEFLNIARSTLWFWLNFLEREGQVELEKTTKYTLVKLKNWSKYQDVGHKWDTNGTQMGTDNNDNNENKGKYGKEVESNKQSITNPLSRSSSGDGIVRESSSPKSFPKEWYDRVLAAYKTLKGITLNGKEYDPVMRDIKLMFLSSRTAEEITDCMQYFSSLGDDSVYSQWTIKTVRMKIPEFLSGKLKA